MIRKMLALFLALITVFVTLCSCGNNDQNNQKDEHDQIIETSDKGSNKNNNSVENDVEDTGKKIDGEIVAASVFSEGLAFVELSGEEGKTYCIDKKGNVVFEFNIDGCTYSTFNNGIAYVNEGFCDKTGKITRPGDVGATSFYYVATLSAGYILAEVVTSTYAETSKKLGVLNTEFEWSVEPSEELHKEFSNEYGSIRIDNVINTSDYTVGDLYYNVDLEKALNLKNGEVINDKTKIGKPESSSWILGSNGYEYTGYYIPDDDNDLSDNMLMVDLTKNGKVCSASSFVNGKAAIVYHNADANRYYVTMIDETGKHLFEPVETKYSSVQTDGKYILVSDKWPAGSGDHAEVFNNKGEKTGEIDVSSDSSFSYSFELGDGVIKVRGGRNGTSKVYYLDTDCNNLF